MPFISQEQRKAFFKGQRRNGNRRRDTGSHIPCPNGQNNAGQQSHYGPAPMYQIPSGPQFQPVHQAWTMPSMAPPPYRSQYIIPDEQFVQFRQFQNDLDNRSLKHFQTLMYPHMARPGNFQPASHMDSYRQPDQPVHPHFMANQHLQPGPGTCSQGSPSNMPWTDGCAGHGVTSHSPSSKSDQTTTVPSSSVEVPLKRKLATSIPEASESNKRKDTRDIWTKTEDAQANPDHADTTIESKVNPATKPTLSKPYNDLIPDLPFTRNSASATLDQQFATVSSSTPSMGCSDYVNSKTNTPASSNSTVKSDSTPSFGPPPAPYNHHSKEDINTLSLNLNIALAESKFDDPRWTDGVLLDEFVCVTKEHFADLRPRSWYSMQTVLAWRASLTIRWNWVVVVHDENPRKHPIYRTTTDIVKVVLEEERSHWTLVHLSINKWVITYYDSFLGLGSNRNDDLNMRQNCNQLVNAVRIEHPQIGITLPFEDPPMSAKCTIKQTDSTNCGPFALREAEKLMGLQVDEDQECPIATRCRHVQSIFKAISKRINEAGPPYPSTAKHSKAESTVITNPKSLSSATAARSTPTSQTYAISTATDTAKPKSASQATTTCSDPSPGIPTLQLKQGYDSMIHDNEYLTHSRLNDSPAYSLENSMLEDSMPPSVSSEYDVVSNPAKPVKAAKFTPRMQRELESTLEAAQQTPMPRAKPDYRNCYRIPLPGVQGGDLSPALISSEDSAVSVCGKDSEVTQGSSEDGLKLSSDSSDNGNAKAEDNIEQSRNRGGFDPMAQTASRPSEEVIANLTPDQRRQAWKSLNVAQLRVVLGRNGKENRSAIIERAVSSNIPFPCYVRWNFLLSSVYAGRSRNYIFAEHQSALRYECLRLDISMGSPVLQRDLADKIISFLDNDGVGHEANRSGSKAHQDRWRELLAECKHRGIPTRGRNVFADIPLVEDVLARHDRKEKECLEYSKDINLPDINIDRHRPALVIICSRNSGVKTRRMEQKYKNEHGRLRGALEHGEVLVGLEKAIYVHVYRWAISLTEPLPITSGRLHKETGQYALTRSLESAERGSQVIFVSIGIDGMSCNEAGWIAMVERYEQHLQLFLIIAEDHHQWIGSHVLWSKHDWLGPIEDRYWACCDLPKLLNAQSGVRLYNQIREQWSKCGAGRLMRGDAIRAEERPHRGRSGKMLRRRQNSASI